MIKGSNNRFSFAKLSEDYGNTVFTRRAALVLSGQAGVLALLAHRLYSIQVSGSAALQARAERNRTSTRLLPPPRGRIIDRDGKPVAENKTIWRALFLSDSGSNTDETLEKFRKIIPLTEGDELRIQKERKRGRRSTPLLVKDYLTWEEMSKIAAESLQLPGIVIDVGVRRVYPGTELLAHLVGYVAPPSEADSDADDFYDLPGIRIGRSGVEQTEEKVLRGKSGLLEVEINASGKVLKDIKKEEPTAGTDIALTIDAVLQRRVQKCIGDRVASVTVMDAQTGAIYAMISTPSFDPGLFDSGISAKQWQELLNDPKTPLVNKSTSGLYPPGSTFKPAVALAALRSGAITRNQEFNCPGYYDIGKTRFHCWNRNGHGRLNVTGALKHSCDVFFYQTARRCGMDAIHAAANELGMGVPLPSIELPNVSKGLIPTPAWREERGFTWKPGDTVNAGIGQGFVQTTPLSLAVYAASLASGRKINPYLVASIGGEEAWQPVDHPEGEKLGFKQTDLDIVRAGMYAVVNDVGGTAPLAKLNLGDFKMAGKTGSAQVRHVSRALRETGHFNSMNLPWLYRPHALFISFAPYDAPRYALSVVVEHGNSGAGEAAPLAAAIMRETLQCDPQAKRAGIDGQIETHGSPF